MTISFKRYVNITSGVAGAPVAAGRQFILRLFSNNPLLAPGVVVEMTTLADVLTYFGSSTAPEYLEAVPYFGFVSKQIKSPTKISYSRWVDAAAAARIYGNTTAKLLATLQAVTAGAFTLTIGGTTLNASALNLSSAVDLPGVAALMQTKIRTGTGTQFTAATVTYDSVTNRFNFVSGSTGAAVLSLTDGAQSPLAALGWISGPGLIVANGADIETITQTLTNSVAISNNFGSYDFVPTLTNSQVIESSTWNDAQNISFMYLPGVQAASYAAISTGCLANAGTGMTLDPIATEYPNLLPGMIWAATDYSQRNAAQNYMFQQGPFTPSVTTDALADTYDAARVNYYGQTQNAGQNINFYQRGLLTGLATDPTDMGVYANEAWFKDAVGVDLLNLFLAETQVPANDRGRLACLAVIQANCDQAVFNGVIETGKQITTTQKITITQFTGDVNAWRQVQTIGYWYDGIILPVVNSSGATEYNFNYTLVYAKGDSIRKVNGTHVLI